MNATSIGWTDFSVNPIRARHKETGAVGHVCEKISPGCGNCYASRRQCRVHMPAFAGAGKMPAEVEPFFDEAVLQKVLRRRKPARVFWCDMTDIAGRWVPDEWIARCVLTMTRTPHLTHQVLTKRIDRLSGLFSDRHFWEGVGEAWHRENYQDPRKKDTEVFDTEFIWPAPNIWLGTSAENQATLDERLPHLLRCPASVRFLSLEPLLGAVHLRTGGLSEFSPSKLCGVQVGGNISFGAWPGIDWGIVGGESGPRARPCNVEWIRSIVNQCKAAGVPCFVKQLGARPMFVDPVHAHLCDDTADPADIAAWMKAGERIWKLKDPKGSDPAEWPEDLRVQEFPKGGAA